MVLKSSRSKFVFSIAFALCITTTQCRTGKVLTWKNLEELYEGGWSAAGHEPGVAFSKPSQVNSTLAPLDSGVTGGGVWSGNDYAGSFNFYTSFEDIQNIIEANITINYYFPETELPIIFYPCNDAEYDVYCNLTGVSTVEWNTQTLSVNLIVVKGHNFFELRTPFNNIGLYILNEVSFSFEMDDSEEPTPIPTEEPTPDPTTPEDPNLCNESCEYRTIDCHNYYSCIDFSYKRYYTCAEEDGLAFSPELGMCDRMEFVEGCAPRPKGNCEYRPDFNNCSNYYFCPDTFKEELCELRSCPRGLRYSVDEETGIQQCTVPSKAKCAKYLKK